MNNAYICVRIQNTNTMIQLDKDFNKSGIGESIDAEFMPTINYTRIQSYQGEMYFTPTKVYLMPHYEEAAMLFHPQCFTYDEVVSYKRKLLAGYEIVLKDGTKVLLSNVFGKMRAGITQAFDEHKK